MPPKKGKKGGLSPEEKHEESKEDKNEVPEGAAPKQKASLIEVNKMPIQDVTIPDDFDPFEDFVLERGLEDVEPADDPVLNYDDIALNWLEKTGFLTDRIVLSGLSHLQRTPYDNDFTFVRVNLANRKLRTISVLGFHNHIQHLNISFNSIEDLSPLSTLPYLKTLNASHNKLTEVLHFKAPMYLTEADFSYNSIGQISDLKEFWSLVKLNLSHNCIRTIQGLESLRYLTYLDLSYNRIYTLENLNHMNIVDLNLSHNRIEDYDVSETAGLWTLLSLHRLKLNHNHINSLSLFQKVYKLKSLDLFNNEIRDLMEISKLRTLKLLEKIVLLNNEVTQWPCYREIAICTLPALNSLDGQEVGVRERTAAKLMYTSNLDISVAKNHAQHVLLHYLNKPYINSDVVPVDEKCPPLFVIVAPICSQKTYLASRIARKLRSHIRMGVNHTTRPMLDGEMDGVHHYFVSNEIFLDLFDAGYFVSTTDVLGASYGFSYNELALAFAEHKGCITSMNLAGALSIRKSPYKPIFILAMPFCEDIYKERLMKLFSILNVVDIMELEEKLRHEQLHKQNSVHTFGVECFSNPEGSKFMLYNLPVPLFKKSSSFCYSIKGEEEENVLREGACCFLKTEGMDEDAEEVVSVDVEDEVSVDAEEEVSVDAEEEVSVDADRKDSSGNSKKSESLTCVHNKIASERLLHIVDNEYFDDFQRNTSTMQETTKHLVEAPSNEENVQNPELSHMSSEVNIDNLILYRKESFQSGNLSDLDFQGLVRNRCKECCAQLKRESKNQCVIPRDQEESSNLSDNRGHLEQSSKVHATVAEESAAVAESSSSQAIVVNKDNSMESDTCKHSMPEPVKFDESSNNDSNSKEKPKEEKIGNVNIELDSEELKITKISFHKTTEFWKRTSSESDSLKKHISRIKPSYTRESRYSSTLDHIPPRYKKLLNTYSAAILKSRENYFKVHQENPGLFSCVVNLDNMKDGYRKIKQFIVNVSSSYHWKRDPYLRGDFTKEMLDERIRTFNYNLKRSINQQQLDDILHQINSPC